MTFRRAVDSSRKRVVMYTEAFWPNVGGGENYCIDLARTLTDLGEDVTVITPVQSPTEDNFSFRVIRMKRPIFFGFNVNFLEPLLDVIRERPKVVLFSGPATSDFVMIPLLSLLHFRIILVFHGQFNKAWGRVMMRIVAPIVYRFVDKIVVETDRDLNYLKDLSVPNEIIEFFIYDGVDRGKFRCPKIMERHNHPKEDGPLKFIFVGGLTSSRPYKGVDILLDIFMKIGRSDVSPTPELIVVGDGDLLKPLRERAKNFQNIHFLGHLRDDELIRELCLSDVLILPSKTDGEGLGKVVFEAVSCGRPAMVSKFAGASELIKKYEAGIIFDPFDVEETVNIIRKLNSKRNLLEKFSSNGQRMMREEGLDLINTARMHISMFEKVLTPTSKESS